MNPLFCNQKVFAMSISGGDSAVKGYGTLSSKINANGADKRKKFRLYGLVQLVYENTSSKVTYKGNSSNKGNSSKSGISHLQQTYKLGLQGYIYDPRLATFDATTTYIQDTFEKNILKSRAFIYDLSITLFPKRPVSIMMFASRSDSRSEGKFLAGNDYVSNAYRVTLTSSLKRLPYMMLQYDHLDSTVGGSLVTRSFDGFEGSALSVKSINKKIVTDELSFFMHDYISRIRTEFRLNIDYVMRSLYLQEYSILNLRANTITSLKSNWFSNYFQYLQFNSSKTLDFSTSLRMSPYKSLTQNYNFEYSSTETERSSSSLYRYNGLWRYNISRLIHARAHLSYFSGLKDGQNQNAYQLNLGFSYSKNLKRWNFSSNYDFSLYDLKGATASEAIRHNLNLSLRSKNFRFWRFYMNYDVSYADFKTSDNANQDNNIPKKVTNSLENRFRVGIRGKGPLRATWLLEADALFRDSSSDQTPPWITINSSIHTKGSKVRNYSFHGSLEYPILRQGQIALDSMYTTGAIDSIHTQSYYYAARLQYNFSRRLRLLARWRHNWENSDLTYDMNIENKNVKTTEYEITLTYLLRKFYLCFNLYGNIEERGSAIIDNKKFMLTVNRNF